MAKTVKIVKLSDKLVQRLALKGLIEEIRHWVECSGNRYREYGEQMRRKLFWGELEKQLIQGREERLVATLLRDYAERSMWDAEGKAYDQAWATFVKERMDRAISDDYAKNVAHLRQRLQNGVYVDEALLLLALGLTVGYFEPDDFKAELEHCRAVYSDGSTPIFTIQEQIK